MTTRRDKESLRKTKVIILTGPRGRRHSTSHRATWENTRVVRREDRNRENA